MDEPDNKPHKLSGIYAASRVYASSWLGPVQREARLLGAGIGKLGHFVPFIGPLAAQPLSRLCTLTGESLASLSHEIRGDCRLEDLPKLAQYPPRLLNAISRGHDRLYNYITSGKLEQGAAKYEAVREDLQKVAPNLKLPTFKPPAAG